MALNLDHVNGLSAADFAAALGDCFELAPWVAKMSAAKRPFATVTTLHDAMMSSLRAASREQQLTFLRGHPDLAGKAARAGSITADSKNEQSSAGLDSLSEEEFARFHRLNDGYKAKF